MLLSVVIPALNEEGTIAQAIEKAFKGMQNARVDGEVIVADNGSNDKTIFFAQKAGARVVHVSEKGYGNAVRGGCAAAQGQWIIYADADNTYDFEQMAPFVEKLKEGYDFVTGNRYKGQHITGSMPFLNRYLGTPVLTFIANLFFQIGIGDINCGMRGLQKGTFQKINCQCSGMEFASEMVVKISLLNLKIAEIPCTLYPPPKGRKPHLVPWRDGWRHLILLTSLFLHKHFNCLMRIFRR